MKIKRVIEIEEDTLKRIDEAKSVPDMFGTDIVNGLNAIANGTPYNPTGERISKSEVEELGATCLARRNEDGQLEAIVSLDLAPTVEITEEQAINKLHETGWLIRHDKEMTTRPQGEWIEKEETPASVSYYCSVCKVEGLPITPFCPWCGADMRAKENKNV